METSTQLQLPAMSGEQLLDTPAIQQVMVKYAPDHVKQGELKQFFVDKVGKLFENQNLTIEQFVGVFNQVIDIDKAKSDAKQLIADYGQFADDPTVKQAVRVLDQEMNELSPIMASIKSHLEDSASGFQRFLNRLRGLFSTGSRDPLASSLQGLQGRIDSIDNAFGKYEQELLLNQKTCSDRIPSLAQEIFSLEGMIASLTSVNAQVSHESTKEFLQNMITQLTIISGIKQENLQRLLVAAKMNGNTHLLLKATEFKVFGLLPGLLSLNFVLASQSKIHKASAAADKFMDTLREQAKDTIEKHMQSEVDAKKKMKSELETIVANIDHLTGRLDAHKQAIAAVNQEVADYLPVYQQRLKLLQDSMQTMGVDASEYHVIESNVIKTLDEQEKLLGKEVEKSEDTQKMAEDEQNMAEDESENGQKIG
jgi:chromosome segregation ATPase